jgi:Zn ribbon nucleic-acid-binding protein
MKILKTANYKESQLDMVECLICGKKRGRDEMANSDVCNNCKDTEDYNNASTQMVQPIKR